MLGFGGRDRGVRRGVLSYSLAIGIKVYASTFKRVIEFVVFFRTNVIQIARKHNIKTTFFQTALGNVKETKFISYAKFFISFGNISRY